MPSGSQNAMEALSRFNRIIGNVYSLDNGLRVLSYSAALYASYLTRKGAKDSEALLELLTNFYTKVGDARFINRFFQLGDTVEGLVESDTSTTLGKLGAGMMVSMMAYYPMEHVWWLSTIGEKYIKIDGDRLSMLSCRAWLVYVICDITGTLLKLRRINRQLRDLRKSGSEDKDAKAMLQRDRSNLKLWLTCTVADFFMAGHWSVENSPLNNDFISLMGVYGGVAGLWLKYRKLQHQ